MRKNSLLSVILLPYPLFNSTAIAPRTFFSKSVKSSSEFKPFVSITVSKIISQVVGVDRAPTLERIR